MSFFLFQFSKILIFSVIGTAFYLMSFIHGTVFKDVRLTVRIYSLIDSSLEFQELSSAAARRRVYFETMKTLAAIHKVDIENGPLNSFAKKGRSSDFEKPILMHHRRFPQTQLHPLVETVRVEQN